jgi:STE24 endopeptidase
LESLNRREVRNNSRQVPEPFREFIDEATYLRSVDYTLAKISFGLVETAVSKCVLLLVLFSGTLPWTYELFLGQGTVSAWAAAAYLVGLSLALSLLGLPLDWYSQFRLEARFGFNTTTPKTWWMDRLKGWLLSVALGYPLLYVVLKCVEWAGDGWWFWAWAIIAVFQVIMVILAPMLILPLFNKFTPLPEGELRTRLMALAERTGFQARDIQVMDGSRRSTHSNAFFTGLGRWRRIVLFDTLIDQLSMNELEAVLAHEIGHFKLRHVPRMLLGSLTAMLMGLFILAQMVGQIWFSQGFGFAYGPVVVVLLVFSLLAGSVSIWISPLINFLSRRFEYQADAYAARTMGNVDSLIQALRKLNIKNLGNLTPHPVYSGFHYSHPTLRERERALKQIERQN